MSKRSRATLLRTYWLVARLSESRDTIRGVAKLQRKLNLVGKDSSWCARLERQSPPRETFKVFLSHKPPLTKLITLYSHNQLPQQQLLSLEDKKSNKNQVSSSNQVRTHCLKLIKVSHLFLDNHNNKNKRRKRKCPRNNKLKLHLYLLLQPQLKLNSVAKKSINSQPNLWTLQTKTPFSKHRQLHKSSAVNKSLNHNRRRKRK